MNQTQAEQSPLYAFFAEAKRRRTRREHERLLDQARLIAENRAAWQRVLDEIRAQLPEVLRPYVMVTDPDILDEHPNRTTHHRYVQLYIVCCAPISLEFNPRCWQIESYWPRQAIGLEETDDGDPYLRSIANEGHHDIYLAVAEAHEHYPVWKNLEEEFDWWLYGTKPAPDGDESEDIAEALSAAARRFTPTVRKLGDYLD